MAEHNALAFFMIENACDHTDERRLSAPTRADEHEQLACAHRQINTAERFDGVAVTGAVLSAVDLDQIATLDRSTGGWRCRFWLFGHSQHTSIL